MTWLETREFFGRFLVEPVSTRYTIAGGEWAEAREIIVKGPPGRSFPTRQPGAPCGELLVHVRMAFAAIRRRCDNPTFRKISLAKQTKKLQEGNRGACECGKDRNGLDEPVSLDCCNTPLRSLLEGCRPG